jgi:hypothetical protein
MLRDLEALGIKRRSASAGGIGVFRRWCENALLVYGISKEAGITYALVVHGAQALVIVDGRISFVPARHNIRQKWPSRRHQRSLRSLAPSSLIMWTKEKSKPGAAACHTVAGEWRAQETQVVFTNGCFDLHLGHVDYLEQARAWACLVVGLNLCVGGAP